MTLYCVEVPWHAHHTPEEYPGLYCWFGSLAKAQKFAREKASNMEWDGALTYEVHAGGEQHQGVVVTKESLPRLSPKKLALWMSRRACSPRGTVVYVVAVKESP